MNENTPLTPEEIERLLSGRGPAKGQLDEALRALRSEFSEMPTSDVRANHLAAMAAAVGQAPTPLAVADRRHRRRFARRVAVGCAASLLVSGTALAATGSLPRPAQDAIAKVAHDVGLNLPHSTQVTNPRAVQNGGVQFANAKKRWVECERSGATDCGPKPKAQDFVHPSATPSETPESTEHHGNGEGHGQGHGVGHTPEPSKTPHPTGSSGDHPSPNPTAEAHRSDGGDHGGDLHTPQPQGD